MKIQTWKQLVEIEPRLAELEREIRRDKRLPGTDALGYFLGYIGYIGGYENSIKNKMSKLVGWYQPNQNLATSEAYEVAYHHLLNVCYEVEQKAREEA